MPRLFACLLLAFMAWWPPCATAAPPARVLVLATLHGLHAEVPAYGFEQLRDSIERLDPDVLCLELQPSDLAARGPEKTKVEYPRVVYPLLERHDYRLYALEPADAEAQGIIAPYLAATQAFDAAQPAQSGAFSAYSEAGLDALRAYWTSPSRVNDATTDAVFAAKHALQAALIGDAERAGWEAWNGHFLAVVERAARENPGRRIVVAVGVEHAYWLRAHLRGRAGILLEDTSRQLSGP